MKQQPSRLAAKVSAIFLVLFSLGIASVVTYLAISLMQINATGTPAELYGAAILSIVLVGLSIYILRGLPKQTMALRWIMGLLSVLSVMFLSLIVSFSSEVPHDQPFSPLDLLVWVPQTVCILLFIWLMADLFFITRVGQVKDRFLKRCLQSVCVATILYTGYVAYDASSTLIISPDVSTLVFLFCWVAFWVMMSGFAIGVLRNKKVNIRRLMVGYWVITALYSVKFGYDMVDAVAWHWMIIDIASSVGQELLMVFSTAFLTYLVKTHRNIHN